MCIEFKEEKNTMLQVPFVHFNNYITKIIIVKMIVTVIIIIVNVKPEKNTCTQTHYNDRQISKATVKYKEISVFHALSTDVNLQAKVPIDIFFSNVQNKNGV